MKKKTFIFRLFTLMAAMMCALGANAQEAYAVYTSGITTLTFYYDNERSSRTGTTYDLNTDGNDPTWYSDGTNANVTRVAFDLSFADARPTTTHGWFSGMKLLETIEGLEHLNTSEVTRMDYMFYECEALTDLDLTTFNTAKVTNMVSMISACKGLQRVDLTSFSTTQVTSMEFMFYYFRNLRASFVGPDWSIDGVSAQGSRQMFYDCNNLVGGQGTTYDKTQTDKVSLPVTLESTGN